MLPILCHSNLYSEVLVPTRRKLNFSHPKLHSINIDNLRDMPGQLGDAKIHHGFCCLGTTMKQAGSRKNFEAVDFEAVVQLAKALKINGTQKFLVISSMGANVNSPFYYNRIKGKMEQALKKINFNHLVIFRPSLIKGTREVPRFGETLADKVMEPLNIMPFGWSQNLGPISGEVIAEAMSIKAADFHTGFETLSSREIKQLKKDPTWKAIKN